MSLCKECGEKLRNVLNNCNYYCLNDCEQEEEEEDCITVYYTQHELINNPNHSMLLSNKITPTSNKGRGWWFNKNKAHSQCDEFIFRKSDILINEERRILIKGGATSLIK